MRRRSSTGECLKMPDPKEERRPSPVSPRIPLGEIRTILVVRNDNIGDVLCTTPALRALRKAFPHAHIAILVNAYSEEAIRGNPDVDEVFVYTKYKHKKEEGRLGTWWRMLQMFRRIWARRFDLAFGMRAGFTRSHGWLVYASRARYRVGYAPPPGDPFRFFLTHAIPPDPAPRHEVERCLDLLHAVGVPAESGPLVFYPRSSDEEEADRFFSAAALNGRDPVVALQPGSRLSLNRWPPERFAALADRLARQGRRVLLIQAPGEGESVRRIMERITAPLLSYAPTSLGSLGAFLKRCALVVCCDGGAMHLAAAVGVPTVALFGATDPRVWGPWGAGHRVVRRGERVEDLTVDEVWHAVVGLLEKAGVRR